MFFNRTCVLCFVLVLCLKLVAAQYKTVDTNNGAIRGIHSTTLLNNISYYSFKGIPYAQPPIGDLRFKAPEPVQSWKPAVLDAFEYSKICTQGEILIQYPYAQSEDCLALNIFVPANVNSNDSLAVLFYIHGGGYLDGASNDFGPDFLLEQNVILITVNYRLGIFGFLSLNLTDLSGNMGLKDQQLALKWINENIGHFGGDPARITVFGHSAGGSSTHSHILSAESRKYFENAVCMSGAIDNYWALSERNHIDLAHKIARDLGEPQTSVDGLATFLKTVSAEQLKRYGWQNANSSRFEILLAPVIERKDAHQPFIVDSMENIYETETIDKNAIFSFASAEILAFDASFMPPIKSLNLHFNVSLPFRGITLSTDSAKYREILAQIRQFYFGDDEINEQQLAQFIALFSDLNFAHGVDQTAKMHANKSNGKAFYYRFSVKSKLRMPRHPNFEHLPGAGHGDELFYLFRFLQAEPIYQEIIRNKNDEESQICLQTINYITKLLSNFAKFGEPLREGDPVGNFRPIEKKGIVTFLDITNDGLFTGIGPNQAANALWERIKKQAQS